MAFVSKPPLRESVNQAGQAEKRLFFARAWQQWLTKLDRFTSTIFPSLSTTPDIVWDDVRMPAITGKPGSIAPTFASFVSLLNSTSGYFAHEYFPVNSIITEYEYFARDYFPDATGNSSTGVYTYLFAPNEVAELHFVAQFPHTYKAHTSVRPHIHWAPTTNASGDVVWGIELAWANVGDTFRGTNIYTVADSADGVALKHQAASFTEISGLDKRESSMVLVRVFRDGTNPNDTYPDDAALLEVDIHINVEKFGTGFEFP